MSPHESSDGWECAFWAEKSTGCYTCMHMTTSIEKAMIWEDRFSVGVQEIDDQHKHMFSLINELLSVMNKLDAGVELKRISESILEYKKMHFETEERYFREFHFEEADAHIAMHKGFTLAIERLMSEYPGYTLEFAFKLVDFLEDWFIGHIMTADQRYVECFHEHGLK